MNKWAETLSGLRAEDVGREAVNRQRQELIQTVLHTPNMKTLGLVVSDKKIIKNCILKTYF